MKKTLAILLVLVFALCLTACGETYTLEGKWKSPVTVVGVTTGADENYMLLEFKANGNGTAKNVSLDEIFLSNFNYIVNGNALTVTSESGKIVECEFKIEGDTLAISSKYKTVEYTRFSD